MKRCSECNFIYEDDQNLCDMDGHQLVSDPTFQSSHVNSATEAPTGPPKPRVRRMAFAVALAMILGALLSVGYSGLTRERVPQTTKAPPTLVNRELRAVPDPIPAPSTAPAPAPSTAPAPATASPSAAPSQSPRLEKTRRKPTAGSPLAVSEPGLRPMSSERKSSQSEPVKTNHKKDTGIGGFLKKTGKILKRPFTSK